MCVGGTSIVQYQKGHQTLGLKKKPQATAGLTRDLGCKSRGCDNTGKQPSKKKKKNERMDIPENLSGHLEVQPTQKGADRKGGIKNRG